jgi:hypothetical protein
VALKSAQPEGDKVDIEEVLDYVDKTLDRTKVLYEQYFLGMQKQPPTQLHTDVERRLRELQQLNIRNTGLRYRFATIQQKFGSYNSYWRRTVRQIENGTYIRNLAKISRNAALTGEEVPEEILAAMPKRMREQVKRDRDQALAVKRRREQEAGVDVDTGDLDDAAVINSSPPKITRPPPMQKGTHLLGGDDGDFDIEAFFASVTDEKPSAKPIHEPEPKDEDTQPNAMPPTRPSHPARTMPIARVAAAGNLPRAVPRIVEDDPTGVHEQRAPRVVEDEPTGVVSPAPRALPGLPTRASVVPGVTSLAPSANPRGSTATPPAGTSTEAPSDLDALWPASSAPGARAPTAKPDAPVSRPPTATPDAFASRPPTATPDAFASRPPTATPTSRPPTAQPDAAASRPPTMVNAPRPPASPEVQAKTQAVPVVPPPRTATPPPIPRAASQAIPRVPITGEPRMPAVPGRPGIPTPPPSGLPSVPPPGQRTQAMPVVPMPPKPGVPSIPKPGAGTAPSQQSRPNPIAPGAASGRQAIPVESMQGPFERTPVAPKPVPAPKPVEQPAQRPPPGMNEADVNALYAKYVKAKEMLGEDAGPGAYGKLMKTINAQAPKIMEQYKAKGVEFSVVVKDNQVIIKAKPKT